MSMLPFYFIAIVVVLYSVMTYGAYLPAFYTYIRNKSQISTSNKQLTQALQELVNAPTLGQFFYQDLITSYVFTNQWDKVLNYSTLALESPINEHSYSIWYYKATAECLLLRLEDCQRSARVANSLSPNSIEDGTSQLFNLVKIMKENKNIKLVSNKNQIMVVLDGSDHSNKKSMPKKTTKTEGDETQKQSRTQKEFNKEQSENSETTVKEQINSDDLSHQDKVKEVQAQVNLAQL